MYKRKSKKSGILVTGYKKETVSWPWKILFYLAIALHNNLLAQRLRSVLTELLTSILIPPQIFCNMNFLNRNIILSCCSFFFFYYHPPIAYRMKSTVLGILFQAVLDFVVKLLIHCLPTQSPVLSTSCVRHTETFTLFQREHSVSHFYDFVYLTISDWNFLFLFYLSFKT